MTLLKINLDAFERLEDVPGTIEEVRAALRRTIPPDVPAQFEQILFGGLDALAHEIQLMLNGGMLLPEDIDEEDIAAAVRAHAAEAADRARIAESN